MSHLDLNILITSLVFCENATHMVVLHINQLCTYIFSVFTTVLLQTCMLLVLRHGIIMH